MRLSGILILAAALTACASPRAGRGECTIVPMPVSAFAGVEHASELPPRLQAALTALAAGDPASPALAAAGLEDPAKSGQLPVTHAMQCLGVTRTSVASPTLVALFLAPVLKNGKLGREEFLMMASYTNGNWYFNWPAGLGSPSMGLQ